MKENCAVFKTSYRYMIEMKIRLELILVITISVMIIVNQTYVDSSIEKNITFDSPLESITGENTEDYNINTNAIKETTAIKQEINEDSYIDSFGKEIYTSFDDAIEDFAPEVGIEGEFSSQIQQGEIQEDSLIIDLPGEGDYNIEGSISNLQSQYIQNPSAEDSEMFYSDTAVQAGLSLERLSDIRSVDGNYLWKFYSQNIVSMAYALYQDDIMFYNNDTIISYNYLLESNSSMQNVVNSSLIVDLVFDTCRIMIIHWHYTNLEPPLIGENTTIPFVVFRLLQNSSWDDQWYNYSLSLYDLFDKTDPYIPTMLKSVGVYALSPEESECSVLIDNFKVTTSVEPEDISLTVNNKNIDTIDVGGGYFDYWDYISTQSYLLTWNYNSPFTINGDYSVNAKGEINIEGEKEVIIVDEIYTSYIITIENLSSTIEFVNITYPSFWELKDNITGCNVLLNENVTSIIAIISLQRIEFEIDLVIEFKIVNLIQDTYFEETTFFEQLNGTINLTEYIVNPSVHIFWYGSVNGSRTIELDDTNLMFTFPSSLTAEEYEVLFIIMEGNYFGYVSETIILTRNPSEIFTVDSLELPIYSLKTINISYMSVESGIEIEGKEVLAYINNEIVYATYEENQFKLQISALYLELGFYSVTIIARSDTHATAFNNLNLTVIDDEMTVNFTYERMEEMQNYRLQFNVTSGFIPVGYAPVIVNLNNETTTTGVTDKNGYYSCEVIIIPTTVYYTISFAVIEAQNTLVRKNFLIEFENLQANIERSDEEVIIADNITLTYDINYPVANSKWFTSVNQEMLPIIDAYIETESLRIPVIWEQNMLFWDYPADNNTKSHKLIIKTTGPQTRIIIEEESDTITLYITIDSENKMFNKLSFMFYINNTYSTSKYDWKLFSNKINDVTDKYNLEINDLYIYFTNIDLVQGSILVLDLIGLKTSNSNTFTNIVIPVLSSSGITLGAITTIVKIYNKKKGMVLEI